MIRILLADDHVVVREGFESLLNEIKGVNVVAVANNGAEALVLMENHGVDIAILDIDMPKMDGITTLIEIRKKHPNMKVIFLSMYSKHSTVKQANKLEVDGFVLKSDSKKELETAIIEINAGEKYYSKDVAKVAMEIFKSPNSVDIIRLTDREKDVLKLMCEDKSTKEIAAILDISKNTVNVHRTKLIEKTGLKTASGLAVFAKENNLI